MTRSILQPWRLLAAGALLAAAVAGALLWGRQSPPAVTRTAAAGDYQLTLELDRAELGQRQVALTVRGADGRPADADAARLRFTMAAMDMGQVEAELRPAGPGRFEGSGGFFSMAGGWVVVAEVLRGGQVVASAPFELAVAAPGEVAGQANPLAADQGAPDAGRALFVASCATCHGDTGRGDGPGAVGLARRPADLTQHMQPGLHTDGQIFAWIKEGKAGTPMPAFGGRLTDAQIWQLVSYLRTLTPQAYPPPAAAGAPAPYPPPAGASLPSYPQPATSVPAAPTIGPAVPTLPEPLPLLIFSRGGNLWRSAGDGTPPRQITDLGQDRAAQQPALSPDGARLAFAVSSFPQGNDPAELPTYELFVSDASGGGAQSVWALKGGTVQMPAWAPDGGAVFVALSGGGDGPRIVRVDLGAAGGAGYAPAVVVQRALDPAVSPDGSLLAYLQIGADGYTTSLVVAALDGSGARVVLDGAGFQGMYAPRFTPDGRRIVFAAVGGPEVTGAGAAAPGPAAAMGGPLAALAALLAPPAAEAHGVPWDLWDVAVAGGEPRRLARLSEDLPMAAVSPDGAQIAALAEGGLYLLGADGTNLRRIDPAGSLGGLTWPRR